MRLAQGMKRYLKKGVVADKPEWNPGAKGEITGFENFGFKMRFCIKELEAKMCAFHPWSMPQKSPGFAAYYYQK